MNNQVVFPYEDKWAVKPEGDNVSPANIFETREEAIEAAKEFAMGKDSGIILLRKDGTIDNTGGIDPYPDEDNAPEFNQEGEEGV